MVEALFAEGSVNEYAVFRLATHVIDALIHGDAVKPTVELGSSLESGKFLIRFEKNLLRQVERIVGVSNNGTDHAFDPVTVAAVELVEYTRLPRLKAGY